MKTIVLEQPGAFRRTDTAPPSAAGAGEALVRVHRVGICGTDLHAYQGNQPFFSYPRILGHELGVEIMELGAGAPAHLAVGDICAVEPYLHCGHCQACRAGKTNCCESLAVLGVHVDGGMRELITVPADKLHPAPGVSVDHLALVEMLCIGAHAVRRAALTPGENVLVIGAGPIGLSVMQYAQLAGASITVLEISQRRLDFCRSQLRIAHAVDPRGDVAAQLRQLLGGDLPSTVFDATGNVNSMNQSFEYVAHGGKLVLVGLVQAEITFHDPHFHRRELTLLSSRNAAREDFAHVIRSIREGQVHLDPWITHRAGPDELVGEFGSWLKPETGVVKAMLEFD